MGLEVTGGGYLLLCVKRVGPGRSLPEDYDYSLVGGEETTALWAIS